MAAEFKSLLAQEFSPYQVLSDGQLAMLESHYDLLCKWNKNINLCRFKDLKEAIELHYCESLYLGLRLPPGSLRIADAGSGAGFPGFPVAVIRPECQVDLIESDKRKSAFLREVSDGVTNLKVVCARLENYSGRYDLVVSRAVRSGTIRSLPIAANGAILTVRSGAVKVPWGRDRFIEMFHVERRQTGA